MTTELVAICVDCGDEFESVDGWLDRCAECCAVRDEHLSGLHTIVVVGCTICESADQRPRAGSQAA